MPRMATGPAGGASCDGVRALTFGGATGVTVVAGGQALSDPISLALRSGTKLLVSVYVPRTPPADDERRRHAASGRVVGTVVTLGDSITDTAITTGDADQRWTHLPPVSADASPSSAFRGDRAVSHAKAAP
jgi:hypothetical protein